MATPAYVEKPTRLAIALAGADEREAIYRFRHDLYARELGQHRINDIGRLCDSLDECNAYLVVRTQNEIAGFISITPPTGPSYSIDKYFFA